VARLLPILGGAEPEEAAVGVHLLAQHAGLPVAHEHDLPELLDLVLVESAALVAVRRCWRASISSADFSFCRCRIMAMASSAADAAALLLELPL